MGRDRIGLARVLAEAEVAAPVRSLDVVTHYLRERFGARSVSFLFVDVVGRRLLPVYEEKAPRRGHDAGQVPLLGSVYDEVLRGQKLVRVSEGARGQRVLAPVTNRGDAIGILELYLTHVTQDVLEQVEEAAHALAYIIVTDPRFTACRSGGASSVPVRAASS